MGEILSERLKGQECLFCKEARQLLTVVPEEKFLENVLKATTGESEGSK